MLAACVAYTWYSASTARTRYTAANIPLVSSSSPVASCASACSQDRDLGLPCTYAPHASVGHNLAAALPYIALSRSAGMARRTCVGGTRSSASSERVGPDGRPPLPLRGRWRIPACPYLVARHIDCIDCALLVRPCARGTPLKHSSFGGSRHCLHSHAGQGSTPEWAGRSAGRASRLNIRPSDRLL